MNICPITFGRVWVREDIPVVRIAESLGVTTRAINYHAHKLGLRSPDRQIRARKKCSDEEFARLWNAGVLLRDIAMVVGYASAKQAGARRASMGLPKRYDGTGSRVTKSITSAQFYEMEVARLMQGQS